MQHVGNHSFGINWGSLTWVDFYNGHWWATFANYDVPYGPNKTPYGYKAATQMVKFTADFKYVESWVLPKAILDKFEAMSNSGGSWGPDGFLYLTGHDPNELYKMRLPAAGSVLELVETIPMNIRGQESLGTGATAASSTASSGPQPKSEPMAATTKLRSFDSSILRSCRR
jgi:hypothetical protein